MPRHILSEGCFSVSVRYLTTNRDGVYWFYRRIPLAAKAKLGLSRRFVRVSLRTRDRTEAIRRLTEVNAEFEDSYGAKLRLAVEARWSGGSASVAEGNSVAGDTESLKEPCSALWRGVLGSVAAPGPASSSGPPIPADVSVPGSSSGATLLGAAPTISEALDLYLSQHQNGANKRFRQNAQLAIGYVVEAVGDLPLDRYTRQNALAVRNAILSKNKTTSVKRRFNAINAIFNAAIQEHGLKLNNPFSGIRIANLGGDTEKREEFTAEELRKLAKACREIADDRRLLLLMLLDTGARLGEVVGLRVSDVDLGQPVPHIHIRPFDGRALKTTSSTRKVPLVGEALWAARKALVGKDTNGLLFPDYGPSGANSASAALNKWIKNTVGIPKTIHGLRHSMKTRLVVAGVPEDIRNRIGGWTDGESVSRGYGSYPLEVLREHLEKVVLRTLTKSPDA